MFNLIQKAMRLVIDPRLLVVATSAVLISSCERSVDQPAPPPPAVTVQAVVKQEVSDSTEHIGQTLAVNQVSIRAKVSGYVDQRLFTEGDDVPEGHQLLVIEQEPFIADVNRAEAALAQAHAALAQASRDVERYQGLVEQGAASKERAEQAETDVLSTEAELKARQAELEQAQLNLGYTSIRAPISGRIGRAEVTEGNLVGPESGELAFLVQLDPIYVIFSVSEKQYIEARQFETEQNVDLREMLIPQIRLPNKTTYEHPGRIDFVDNRVDETTGTIAIRCVFPNPDQLLLPGQFVTVEVGREEPREELLVPQIAVLEDQGGRYVLAVDGENKVEVRRIETDRRYGSSWILKSGLQEGDRVIVQGLQKVQPGMMVNATSAPSAVQG